MRLQTLSIRAKFFLISFIRTFQVRTYQRSVIGMIKNEAVVVDDERVAVDAQLMKINCDIS